MPTISAQRRYVAQVTCMCIIVFVTTSALPARTYPTTHDSRPTTDDSSYRLTDLPTPDSTTPGGPPCPTTATICNSVSSSIPRPATPSAPSRSPTFSTTS